MTTDSFNLIRDLVERAAETNTDYLHALDYLELLKKTREIYLKDLDRGK